MEREPERVEIELTPTDAPKQRRAPATVHVPSPPQLLATERSRLITTGVVVGVFAVVLGWLVGRAGGENGVTTDADPTPTSTATSEPSASSVPLLATDTIAPVATTTTTTSTLPQNYVVPVDVDRRLSGSGVQLVGSTSSGDIFDLDLDAGLLQRTGGDRRYIEPSSLMAGAGWLAYQTYDNQTGLFLITANGERIAEVPFDGNQVLHLPGSDLFWRPVATSDVGRPERWEEFDLSGAATGRALDVPAGWTVAVDPTGGLVVQESAKTFRVDLDNQISLLADGELLGLDESVVVFRGCDDQLTCSVWELDRATGDRRPIDVNGPDDSQMAGLLSWGPYTQPTSMSPNSDALAVLTFGPTSPGVSVIDLDSGDTTELIRSIDQYPGVSWSADGRWAFFLDQRTPMCYDRETGETFPVADEISGWESVLVRPDPA